MNALYALAAVTALLALAYLGVGGAGLQFAFGVVIPYAAISIFLLGFTYRILHWAGSAVPFRIPTTSGQQKTLPFLKSDNLDLRPAKIHADPHIRVVPDNAPLASRRSSSPARPRVRTPPPIGEDSTGQSLSRVRRSMLNEPRVARQIAALSQGGQ